MLKKSSKRPVNPYARANALLLFVAALVYVFGTTILPNINKAKDGFYTPSLTVDGVNTNCPIGILAIENGVQYIGGYEASKLLSSAVKTEEGQDGSSYKIIQSSKTTTFFMNEKYIIVEDASGNTTRADIKEPPLYVEGMWYIPVSSFSEAFGYNAVVVEGEKLSLDFARA